MTLETSWKLEGCISMQNLDVMRGSNRIAMIDCENEALCDTDILANAHLIAAAPDMLAALERAYEKLGFWMDDDKWDHGDESAMVQIWEAISKARGI